MDLVVNHTSDKVRASNPDQIYLKSHLQTQMVPRKQILYNQSQTRLMHLAPAQI